MLSKSHVICYRLSASKLKKKYHRTIHALHVLSSVSYNGYNATAYTHSRKLMGVSRLGSLQLFCLDIKYLQSLKTPGCQGGSSRVTSQETPPDTHLPTLRRTGYSGRGNPPHYHLHAAALWGRETQDNFTFMWSLNINPQTQQQ